MVGMGARRVMLSVTYSCNGESSSVDIQVDGNSGCLDEILYVSEGLQVITAKYQCKYKKAAKTQWVIQEEHNITRGQYIFLHVLPSFI